MILKKWSYKKREAKKMQKREKAAGYDQITAKMIKDLGSCLIT